MNILKFSKLLIISTHPNRCKAVHSLLKKDVDSVHGGRKQDTVHKSLKAVPMKTVQTMKMLKVTIRLVE